MGNLLRNVFRHYVRKNTDMLDLDKIEITNYVCETQIYLTFILPSFIWIDLFIDLFSHHIQCMLQTFKVHIKSKLTQLSLLAYITSLVVTSSFMLMKKKELCFIIFNQNLKNFCGRTFLFWWCQEVHWFQWQWISCSILHFHNTEVNLIVTYVHPEFTVHLVWNLVWICVVMKFECTVLHLLCLQINGEYNIHITWVYWKRIENPCIPNSWVVGKIIGEFLC